MTESLQARKQELVRNTIWDAAIERFAAAGFDNVTIEEIAQAAGVSRRTFFRYFASKDDLMSQSVVNFGEELSQSIGHTVAAHQYDPLAPQDLIRTVVIDTLRAIAANPRTPLVLDIAARSQQARLAQLSRLAAAEERVTRAYAEGIPSADELTPRLMASVTFWTIDLALRRWHADPAQDLAAIVHAIFESFHGLFRHSR